MTRKRKKDNIESELEIQPEEIIEVKEEIKPNNNKIKIIIKALVLNFSGKSYKKGDIVKVEKKDLSNFEDSWYGIL